MMECTRKKRKSPKLINDTDIQSEKKLSISIDQLSEKTIMKGPFLCEFCASITDPRIKSKEPAFFYRDIEQYTSASFENSQNCDLCCQMSTFKNQFHFDVHGLSWNLNQNVQSLDMSLVEFQQYIVDFGGWRCYQSDLWRREKLGQTIYDVGKTERDIRDHVEVLAELIRRHPFYSVWTWRAKQLLLATTCSMIESPRPTRFIHGGTVSRFQFEPNQNQEQMFFRIDLSCQSWITTKQTSSLSSFSPSLLSLVKARASSRIVSRDDSISSSSFFNSTSSYSFTAPTLSLTTSFSEGGAGVTAKLGRLRPLRSAGWPFPCSPSPLELLMSLLRNLQYVLMYSALMKRASSKRQYFKLLTTYARCLTNCDRPQNLRFRI